MAKLVYLMNVSLDGYVADASGSLAWTRMDEELHSWFNEQQRRTAVELYGRRLWETMTPYWPEAASDPNTMPVELEYAEAWLATPTVVFSRTLESVGWNGRLVREDPIGELKRISAELPPDAEVSVGGPTLATPFVQRDLVDEYRLLVHPAVVGNGLPFWPPLERPLRLELVEQRRFRSGVVLIGYRSLHQSAEDLQP